MIKSWLLMQQNTIYNFTMEGLNCLDRRLVDFPEMGLDLVQPAQFFLRPEILIVGCATTSIVEPRQSERADAREKKKRDQNWEG